MSTFPLGPVSVRGSINFRAETRGTLAKVSSLSRAARTEREIYTCSFSIVLRCYQDQFVYLNGNYTLRYDLRNSLRNPPGCYQSRVLHARRPHWVALVQLCAKNAERWHSPDFLPGSWPSCVCISQPILPVAFPGFYHILFHQNLQEWYSNRSAQLGQGK